MKEKDMVLRQETTEVREDLFDEVTLNWDMEDKKSIIPQIAKAILRETEEKKSGSLTSNYTTELQSSGQYGTDTKTEMQINETGQKAQK